MQQKCSVPCKVDDADDDDRWVVNEETLVVGFYAIFFFVMRANELCTSCAATHKVDLLLLHRGAHTTMIKSSAKTKANLGHYRQCHFVHWTK